MFAQFYLLWSYDASLKTYHLHSIVVQGNSVSVVLWYPYLFYFCDPSKFENLKNPDTDHSIQISRMTKMCHKEQLFRNLAQIGAHSWSQSRMFCVEEIGLKTIEHTAPLVSIMTELVKNAVDMWHAWFGPTCTSHSLWIVRAYILVWGLHVLK